MAGTKGYSSYRGREAKWRIAAAALLCLVILGAGVVLLLQRHIVYDDTGTPRLELPWNKEVPENVPQKKEEKLDLVIQEPEKGATEEIRAYAIPQGKLTLEALEDAVASADPSCRAVMVTIKDDDGKIYMDSRNAVHGSLVVAQDTAAALEWLNEEAGYTIARLGCFRDAKAANADVKGMGLENTGGYIFYDGNNSQWLDPAKPDARRYLCDLAKEAAALGFDEIMLAGVGYPVEGSLEKISYGEVPKEENLLLFLEELRTELEPYSVALSMEVPASLIDGDETALGLTLAQAVSRMDRIYAAVLPEDVNEYAQKVAAAEPAVLFVPVLEAHDAGGLGNFLIS